MKALNHQPSRQEQMNELLSALMTAAMVDTKEELENWLDLNQFSYSTLSELGNLIRLTIDMGERFKNRTERRYLYVKNDAARLKLQGW
jgi:hypothetical protein